VTSSNALQLRAVKAEMSAESIVAAAPLLDLLQWSEEHVLVRWCGWLHAASKAPVQHAPGEAVQYTQCWPLSVLAQSAQALTLTSGNWRMRLARSVKQSLSSG
jgi:hypothetical protein